MRVLALVGCAVAVSLATNTSLADEGSPAPTAAATYSPPPVPYYPPPPAYAHQPPPPPKRAWYGWQTLSSDALAVTLLYAAAQSRSNEADNLGYASLLAYSVGAPTIHFAHDNFALGGLSLAFRCLPATLIFTDARDSEMLVLLTVLSVPAMIAIDASLGREPAEEVVKKGYAVKVAPTVSAVRNGGLVGLAGRF